MRVHLQGLHKVTARLADGRVRTYHYAWRGGPRLEGEPGTPAFLSSYAAAVATRSQGKAGTLGGLITEFKASSEFGGLRERTRKDYRRYLDMIEARFGEMPIEVLEDPRVRGDFKAWRDEMAATPRKADFAWTILARVLSVAHDRGRIAANPCERGGRLYTADRADRVWTEEMVTRFLAVAPEPLRRALMLALWTGQRQGDLVALTWSAYDGAKIRLKQSKTGARVAIPIGAPLKAVLDEARRAAATARTGAVTILATVRGTAWTGDGFRTSWRKACIKAGIEGVTFHDLRGSAVTRLAVAGATVPQIAAITGHSLGDVQSILDSHYLGDDPRLAETAILKLERHERRTKSVKRAVKRSTGSAPNDP